MTTDPMGWPARSASVSGLARDRRGRHRTAAGNVADALGFGVFLVHGTRRQAPRVARPVRDAVRADHEGDGTLQHQHSRIEPMRVRLPVLVGFDLALTNLVALAQKIGFEL